MDSSRLDFLTMLGSVAAVPGTIAAAPNAGAPISRALVLSGGGARGAYEAGIIGSMVASGGIRDGEPLAPYGLVCGTSIGALNGWFVATGQYSALKELWYGVSAAHLIQLKPKFAALRNSNSGVGDRFLSALYLASLTKNEAALLDSAPVLDWITTHVDLQRPLLVPLVWVATNLTAQRAEYFYARPPNAPPRDQSVIIDALHLAIGPNTVVREASVDLFHREIFASACIPLAFDPVAIPQPDGSLNDYCDGGVASNSPVTVAHSVSAAVDVVLIDPPFEPITDYTDALAVALGTFGTMQRKILTNDMRSVYFQSLAKHAFTQLSPSAMRNLTQEEPMFRTLFDSLPATDLRYVRPKSTLPVGTGAFSDEEGIGKAYRIGWEDAQAGFTPYDWRTFDA
jgi:predicted acylesterase/phospholipase RssA